MSTRRYAQQLHGLPPPLRAHMGVDRVLPFAQHSHLFPETGVKAVLLRFQIVTSLEIQPEPLGRAEVPDQVPPFGRDSV